MLKARLERGPHTERLRGVVQPLSAYLFFFRPVQTRVSARCIHPLLSLTRLPFLLRQILGVRRMARSLPLLLLKQSSTVPIATWC